jgi:hypothetical protein
MSVCLGNFDIAACRSIKATHGRCWHEGEGSATSAVTVSIGVEPTKSERPSIDAVDPTRTLRSFRGARSIKARTVPRVAQIGRRGWLTPRPAAGRSPSRGADAKRHCAGRSMTHRAQRRRVRESCASFPRILEVVGGPHSVACHYAHHHRLGPSCLTALTR